MDPERHDSVVVSEIPWLPAEITPDVFLSKASRAEIAFLASRLDAESSKDISHPSQIDSESIIAWVGSPAYRTPLAVFGYSPMGNSVGVWMVTCAVLQEEGLHRQLIRGMREVLRRTLLVYKEACGVCRKGSPIERLLVLCGSSFSNTGDPNLLRWSVLPNRRLL